ncbi:MAG: iron chelate uptake ABC transporter family permease subunit [Nitrospirales bacterium]|nr:iron chelate uptake ABC transporter family permease subunit [Nitrospirales bacterium]
MYELLEILHPSYVLRNALYGGVLTGLVLPLIGVLMYARRMVFLGIALPQVSATGIVAAIFYHIVFHRGAGPHSDFLVALIGSTVITTGILVVLAALERHGGGLVEGRIGATYVLAGAITILFLASERIPEVGVIKLLRGQIIAISDFDMVLLLVFYSVVVFALWYFRRDLLLISVDRDIALSMGKQVWVWDLILYGLVGMTVSLGVLTVGPLLTFAFLLLPPMVAFRLSKRFRIVPSMAASFGGLIAFLGFVFSYFLDWPTGATNALLSCLLLGVVTSYQWVLHLKAT